MASSTAAKPLKVVTSSTPNKTTNGITNNAVAATNSSPLPGPSSLAIPGDITSPHELTAFVETLLGQLDAKFDEMSTQILDRMNQMASRVDSLEASIQDIINSDINNGPSVPQSPIPTTPRALPSSSSVARRSEGAA